MKNQENTTRDSYGKVNYVNSYHNYTGNVGQLTYGKDNERLNESLNKTSDLLDEKYLLVQRGKKNYYLIIAK